MNNILEVKEIVKKYPDFLLDNISFTLPRGYIMGFIGSNGAGKTTTIKAILGIIKTDSGEISAPPNDKIGIVMDTPFYIDEWTSVDTEKAIAPFYSRWNSETFTGYLKKFNLDPKKKIKDMSRGMKVKIQIAAALSHDAELLILDEPTSGLDPVARDEVCDILRDFVSDEKKSVLFSTHITTDLEKTADFITFIGGGKLLYTGEKDGLLEKYVRVSGGLSDISAEQKKQIIGYREHSTGFEGMMLSSEKSPKNVLRDPVSLDEIIVFMNGGKKDE
ncbi:MAG: ABC transporter ATP-binding protein [Ruminococcus sp.]|jgi:ABC-2 type transport system ATP-binding protein|nr:ABC transporter ATP-binding protein [Ruminococcus sp.]